MQHTGDPTPQRREVAAAIPPVPRVTAIVPQFAHSELRPGRVVSGTQQAERREKSEATPVP